MSIQFFKKGTDGLMKDCNVDIKMFHTIKSQEMNQRHSFHNTMDWHKFV